MMFSDCTDCYIINGTCGLHSTCHMLQIFSLKLANIPVEHGPVELYGYIIWIGRHEKEDLQLIDGVSLVDDIDTWNCSPFTSHLHGGCGGIDITASRLNFAVEATVEVAILQVRGGFNMRLGCFTMAADSCIPAEHCCSFKATKHGRATQEIKTDFVLISVKVTWSTLD
ncbi:hypothetical protein SETIT_1G102800v2 [Setaria italica]|uniref:DUF6598 domain-containing protein n=1 Tax=Setaria italica TaxID=4555 RepID=A0A368PJA4_SETIT|nr:hypothetical protein SETIT_1G102800v2 [Setaria italica]